MRVQRLCALAMVVAGCGGKDEAPSASPTPSPLAVAAPDRDEPPPPPPTPAFPDGTRSLVLKRTIPVRLAPGVDAKRIGTIGIDTRVGWTRTADATGCKKPWVEIVPRGWVCGEYLEPSTKAPMGREVPMLDRGELVPGIYGKVTEPASLTYVLERPGDKKPRKAARTAKADRKARATERPVTTPRDVTDKLTGPRMREGKPLVGSVNVRHYGEIEVDGKTYWKISRKDNEYVLRKAIRQHVPSEYSGARLGDDTGWSVPIAFVWPRAGRSTSSLRTPTGGAVRKLAARTPVPILETATDRTGKPTAYRIGEGEWLRAVDVRVYEPAPAPPYLEPGERWIDVDLDNQILVAFEGDVAVYATMVSSGGPNSPTETGVYRMWLKESETDMRGLNGEDPYSVATVPWTQFFYPEKGLALHTAYWHDGFGVRRSAGCVNLAPKDARWLYFWSEPQVPPGWTMTAGVTEAPGSIVRVRSKADPNPEHKGYAKDVFELRKRQR